MLRRPPSCLSRIAIWVSLLSAACSHPGQQDGSTSASPASLKCEHVINYQGKDIEIGGATVPISVSGASQEIKVGTVSLKPTSIREASDLIKALDLAQFSSCQNLLALRPEDRPPYVEKKDAYLWLMSRTLGALQAAPDDSAYVKATADAKAAMADPVAALQAGQSQ
jgi:hypothetical protein